MSKTTDTVIDKKENAKWHYEHCEIEREDDRDSGTTAWCIEHEVDVTECLPGWDYEPDLYEGSEENINAN